MMHCVESDRTVYTPIICFMWQRNWDSYNRLFHRLKEIFQQQKIKFEFEIYASDCEVNLIKLGALFDAKHNLRCQFHIIKVCSEVTIPTYYQY